MRKALFGLLITAAAAVPSFAATADAQSWRQDRQTERAERQVQRAESRAARQQQNVERRIERAQRNVGESAWAGQRFGNADRRSDRFERVAQPQVPAQARVAERNWRGGETRQRASQQRSGQWDGNRDRQWNGDRDRNRNWNNDNDRRWDGNRDRRWSDRGDRNRSRHNWNRNWRNDHRYDWQRYRSSHRSLFNSGRYYAPYRGYNYRRFSIGLFLEPLFYSSNYWIGDPWQYRLPPAYPGTRWVRYYDDVLLVDVYSGEVVDVIYDFFW